MSDASFAELLTPADGLAARTSETTIGYAMVYNGTNFDLLREISAGLNSTGTGVLAAGLVGQLDDVSTTAVTENQFAPLRITGARAVHVNLRNNAGTELTTGVQYIEDAALGVVGSGQGTLIIGRASATVPTSVSTDGDAVGLWALKNGILNTRLVDSAGTAVSFGSGGTSATDEGAWTAATSTLTPTGGVFNDSAAALTSGQQGTVRLTSDRRMHVAAEGDIAAGTTDSGNPVKIGGLSSTGIPTAVTTGQRVNAWIGTIGTSIVSLTPANGAGSDGVNIGLLATTAAVASTVTLPTSMYGYNGTNSDRLRSIAALDAAPNVDTGILAVGVGPGWDRKRTNTGSPMAVTLNAATTLVVDGAATVMFAFKFNTVTVGTGTLVFEVAADDVTPTWVTAPTVMKMPDQTAVGSTFTPVNNTQYMVSTAGWRQVRVRVAAALTSGTIDVLTTASAADAITTLADRQRVASYGAVFRLAETTSSLALSFAQVANTTKQWATIHHASTALKLVKIRKVTFWLYSTSAVLDGILELRRITAAPATGNPAITPAAHDPANAAAEATCLALPTTAGTEAAVNSPVASIGLNLGITTANVNATGPIPFVLWDTDKYTDSQSLVIRPLTLEGWAVDLRSVGATTVKATIEVQFTEE